LKKDPVVTWGGRRDQNHVGWRRSLRLEGSRRKEGLRVSTGEGRYGEKESSFHKFSRRSRKEEEKRGHFEKKKQKKNQKSLLSKGGERPIKGVTDSKTVSTRESAEKMRQQQLSARKINKFRPGSRVKNWAIWCSPTKREFRDDDRKNELKSTKGKRETGG